VLFLFVVEFVLFFVCGESFGVSVLLIYGWEIGG